MQQPVDIDANSYKMQLPEWYDKTLFKRLIYLHTILCWCSLAFAISDCSLAFTCILHHVYLIFCRRCLFTIQIQANNIISNDIFRLFLLRRAQDFYMNNLFAMFAGKLSGLLAVLAIPSILKILICTKASSTPYTAYKRYLETVFHTMSWYEHDLKPGSR